MRLSAHHIITTLPLFLHALPLSFAFSNMATPLSMASGIVTLSKPSLYIQSRICDLGLIAPFLLEQMH